MIRHFLLLLPLALCAVRADVPEYVRTFWEANNDVLNEKIATFDSLQSVERDIYEATLTLHAQPMAHIFDTDRNPYDIVVRRTGALVDHLKTMPGGPDLTAPEFGAHDDLEKQRAGEAVWPMMDVDPENPTGVESDRPSRGTTTVLRELRYRGYLNSKGGGKGFTVHFRGLEASVTNPSGEHVRLSLFTAAGRIRTTSIFDGNRSRIRIDLSNAVDAPGMYYVRLTSGRCSNTRRVAFYNR